MNGAQRDATSEDAWDIGVCTARQIRTKEVPMKQVPITLITLIVTIIIMIISTIIITISITITIP
jgi:heme/copper-type cytochrome/quinol oxidase subunit 1